jgi:serine/threonine protein kinase
VPAVYFQEKPNPFIVMEYCCLGNLEALQDIKPEEYVSASRQMLIGLRHLHNNRVAHRDLKPANLLVANRHPFHVKISDFGLSKVVARNGFLKTFCGTLLYAAPEVCPVGRTGYLPSIDIWSVGVMMMQFIFGLPYYDSNDQRPRTEWIKDWANMLLSRIGDLDENNDQVIDLIKNMVTMRPENRFTADECLERGCVNGLFKRRSDGQIVDIDTPSEDDATELATEAGTEIASPPADPSDDSRSDDGGSDDGCATPTRQSPQRTEGGASNSSEAPTILIKGLWSSDKTGQQDSADSPSGQLTPTRRSNLGPPARRRRTSRNHTSSWSLTIGLGHSDSDGGFDLDGGHSDGAATGLFIRKDRFSLSLENQFASEDETQEESSVRQGSLALPEPEQGVSVPMVLTSFEQRVLQLQA